MSETMAASERARQMAFQHAEAAYDLGQGSFAVSATDERRKAFDDTAAALLAYVARLEACVAAARLIDSPVNWGPHTDQLIEALAALDRPEDGEHGDKD